MVRGQSDEVIAIDTGIWLEGLLYGGSAEELVKMAVTGRVNLISSEGLLDKLARTLERRLGFSEAAIDQVRQFVRECTIMVDDGDVDFEGPHPVLELAHRAGATAIATTDNSELLRRKTYLGIPIVRVT